MTGKTVSQSKTIMTEMIMPNDTNPSGNLMGGNLMRWMDIAAAICAGKHCESSAVTASVDHVSFQKAINNGDVITLEAVVTRAFKTSIEIYVEVTAADFKGGNQRRCNHAYFTFVSLDANNKPQTAPPVIPISQQEEKQYMDASKRRELRLLLSGRLKPDEVRELKTLLMIPD